MRMIGLLFSVVKLKFLSISNANHKKLWKNYIIVNASFFLQIIYSDTLLFLNYSRCNTTSNKRTNDNSC
jgi:hypothetical protein